MSTSVSRIGSGSEVQSRTLAEEAFALIRQQLVRCELPPGSRFTEGDLSALLGLGKTPVREALAQLAYLGFVRALPRIGYEATPVTLADVRDVFGMRSVVEPAAAREAAGHVDEPLLRGLQKQLCEAHDGTREGFELFLQSNHELHLHIAEASGSRCLARTVEELLYASERIYRVGLSLEEGTAMAHSHVELIDALVAGDSEKASEIMTMEMTNGKSAFFEMFLRSSSIQHAPITR